jgi:uncharacterized membrane protein YgcG
MKTKFRITVVALTTLMLLGTPVVAQQTADAANVASTTGDTPVTYPQTTTPFPADSQVRIVRLSQLSGDVQIDRNTGQGFEKPLLNLPVTQGATLRTGSGLAEIEFEDNSLLHLTPNTVVQFQQLELLQSGTKASTVNIEAGTAYVSLAKTKGDEFALAFGHEKVNLAPSAHVRLRVAQTKARLAVFDGSVRIKQPTGTTSVGKKKTLTFDLTSQSEPVLSKKVSTGRYDAWDQAEIAYHKQYAKSSAYGSIPNLSGISDMNYYGMFAMLGDCGRMWRPFFAGAAWDPFANGSWGWYPGTGWTWVSPYPWGWTAYHYGAWEYCPVYGWGWRPGGSWVGLKNAPQPKKPPQGFPPPRPPLPPTPGHPTVVAVNPKPPVASGFSSPDRFVIRKDSAGLGIWRGALEEPGKMSGQLAKHGNISVPVYSNAASEGTSSSLGSSSRGTGEASHASGHASPPSMHASAASYSGGMGHAGFSGASGHMSMGGGSRSAGGGGSAHK